MELFTERDGQHSGEARTSKRFNTEFNMPDEGIATKKIKRACRCVHEAPTNAQIWKGPHADVISHVYKCITCGDIAFCAVCQKGFVWKRKQPFICEHVSTQLHCRMDELAKLKRKTKELNEDITAAEEGTNKHGTATTGACSCEKRHKGSRSVKRHLIGCSCAIDARPKGSKLWNKDLDAAGSIWIFECQTHRHVAYCDLCNEVIRFAGGKQAYLKKHILTEKHKVRAMIQTQQNVVQQLAQPDQGSGNGNDQSSTKKRVQGGDSRSTVPGIKKLVTQCLLEQAPAPASDGKDTVEVVDGDTNIPRFLLGAEGKQLREESRASPLHVNPLCVDNPCRISFLCG